MNMNRKHHDNVYNNSKLSALAVYNNIINEPYKYPALKDAAIDSMNNDGEVGGQRCMGK